MNDNSIEHIQECYIEDYNQWTYMIDKSLKECLGETDTSVISQLIQINKSNADGPLAGVPYAVKDLFDVCGFPSRNSSVLPEFNACATKNSAIIERMSQLGATCVAKTQMNEFAYGLTGENPHFGNCRHPLLKNCLSGGSSSGSAYLVAADYLPLSFGTDTGGSIRQPAAFCGIVGMKPTYGRCSRWGIIAFASSLDQAGPLTRNVSDSATMLKVMAGHDPKDSTSSLESVPNFNDFLDKGVKGLKIGIPEEYDRKGISEEILNSKEKVIDLLKQNGAEIVNVSLPLTKYALPVYYIVAPAEASSNLARYDGVRYGLRVDGDSLDDMYEKTRANGFGDEVKRRIMIGTYVLSSGYYDAYYLKAQKVRRLIKNEFDEVFKKVDYLLTPTTPTTSFKLGSTQDLLTMYLNDVFTVPASLAGIPGISVPIDLDKNGLPIGIQLLGKPFDEGGVFQVGKVIEDCAEFNFSPEGNFS